MTASNKMDIWEKKKKSQEKWETQDKKQHMVCDAM